MAFFHLGLFFILLFLQPHPLPARYIIADFNQGKDFRGERVPNHNEIAAVNRRGGGHGGGGGGGHGGGVGGGHGGVGGGGGHVGGQGRGQGNGRRTNPAAVVIPVIAGASTINRHRHGATGNSSTLNRPSTLRYFLLTIWVCLLLSQI